MSLRIFNTLTLSKEDFTPITNGKVNMYVCGVTVYDFCHVGHARAAIVFDTIFRYLKHLGFEVSYVRNFTDIDDKIIKRAQEENITWKEVTEKYIDAFYQDMGQLNIESPTQEPKATEHINTMLKMVSSLVDQGKAYESDGDVYYSVRSFEEYGKLSGRNLDDLLAGARVEIGEHKKDPLDFALWKRSKPGEPSWESPWGPGRPGWHIECSAMSYEYLGEQFDIHGGGKDLVFPHHENEVAQSCGFTGKPPVKYWIHNGFVNINKEKMSKSLGNFFTIRDILEKYHPESLRLFLISNHYRSPIDFSDQNLEEASKVLDRFYEFFVQAEKIRGDLSSSSISDQQDLLRKQPLLQKLENAMNDDFNTAVVLAHLNEELRNLNKLLAKKTPREEEWLSFDLSTKTLKYCGQLLGLFFRKPEDYLADTLELRIKSTGLDVNKIESLIEQRTTARKSKEFQKADQCRDELTKMGVIIEDSPSGTTWKLK